MLVTIPALGLIRERFHQFTRKTIAMKPREPIVCRKCRFYYITWDNRKPHGCRAMNFKSRRPPSLVVRQSSGQECLRYTPKDETDSNVP